MEGFIAIVVILVFGFVFFVMPYLGGAPKKNKLVGKDEFRNKITHCVDYMFYNDETGYAISVKENKITFPHFGNTKCYDLSAVRSIEYEWQTPEQTRIYGKSTVSQTAQVAGRNTKATRDAYDNSGIFIKVKDIEAPVHHVKFTSKDEMMRSYEILNQFIDGELDS